jgi:hypothetical protein
MRDGRWSAAGPTDSTADPQQVDMPARNKEGVSGGHVRSITRAISFCPESFSPPGAARGQRPADAHARTNRPAGAAIPDSRFFMRAPGNRAGHPGHFLTYRAGQPGLVTYRAGQPGLVTYRAGQPGLVQLTGDSDGLAGQTLAGRQAPARTLPDGVGQMAPGHGMTAKSCCNCRPCPAVAAVRDTRVRGPDQAAFARRILRRRSEARSSSLRPPQVPYFSGRDTA